jgi:hypothetical protein
MKDVNNEHFDFFKDDPYNKCVKLVWQAVSGRQMLTNQEIIDHVTEEMKNTLGSNLE